MSQLSIIGKGTSARQAIHYVGMPPVDTLSTAQRVQLPEANFVLLEEVDGAFTLTRFTFDGELAGDTWHPNKEEALEQAAFEFGDCLGEWIDLPKGLEPVVFARSFRTSDRPN